VGRHSNDQFDNFAMCNGSCSAVKTNTFCAPQPRRIPQPVNGPVTKHLLAFNSHHTELNQVPPDPFALCEVVLKNPVRISKQARPFAPEIASAARACATKFNSK
jgi:hypothetical protein